MGGCFSSDNQQSAVPSAKVISLTGDLHEYPIPFTVSQLLLSSSSCFVCNSDSLYYDDYITALNNDDFLHPNQIYFILPISKLHHRLSASDMAALAVKASLALQNSSAGLGLGGGGCNRRQNNNNNKKARISPVVLVDQESDSIIQTKTFFVSQNTNTKTNTSSPPSGISRSGSIRKLHRYSSKRAKMAVRSFRLSLTTIYEGSVLYI